MIEITGMLISGKMSVAMFSSANGVARTISIAMTMNVYGRFSASWTIDIGVVHAGAAAGAGRSGAEPGMIFRGPDRRRQSLTGGCRLVPQIARSGWPTVGDSSDTSPLPPLRELHGHDHHRIPPPQNPQGHPPPKTPPPVRTGHQRRHDDGNAEAARPGRRGRRAHPAADR